MDAVLDKIKVLEEFIFWVGSSGLSALELNQRLIRMGMNSVCVTDSHMMLINSSLVTQGCVIGISVSGETTDINKAIRLAKLRGLALLD